ncbi:uncharacterized protein LOC119576146 [Penaeus monodon]|uniref:uncharacterized protein LOC119576146 n=1 Tax=Penaeus monodon TaxID=6687 RepID=UPI0018A7B1E0|nr:uncharacterized protein LOC119576146 [Penaeus monodon]
MASPTIESLCCLSSTNAFTKDFLIDFQSVPYNTISIAASFFGIAGAIYQVLPRTPSNGANGRGGRFFKTRGRLIIRWLAFADLLASFGILIRSATWLADDTFGSKPDDSKLGQSMCIITSVRDFMKVFFFSFPYSFFLFFFFFFSSTSFFSFSVFFLISSSSSASSSPPSASHSAQ